MKPLRPTFRWLFHSVGLAATVILLTAAFSKLIHPRSLGERDFVLAAPQGFDDRDNSWAWSMQWWRGELYVGTNRAYWCVRQWELHRAFPSLFPYPPPDPDLDCAEDPAGLSLQAEIWRWTPEINRWERAYQSPNDVPNPDRAGKLLPRDNGYRSMTVHTDPDGTEALYVGGINTKPMWDGEVPPPRILRTTDGVNFEAIRQDAGTFMGELPKASFRSLTSHDGQLFVVHGPVYGNGVILTSADPAQGNDAWCQFTSEPLQFTELATFNGWLYLAAMDYKAGYSVYKTRASDCGTHQSELLTVLERGGYHAERPSGAVLNMHVFNGRLYVGTEDPSEIIRINPDDTWDVVVGEPRETPHGWKYPLSGLGEGFGNGFNDHIWRMQDHQGHLYAGTFDSSTTYMIYGWVRPRVEHLAGFDLYRTADDWYFTPITVNGLGDRFSFGARSFSDTPYGLFCGTADPYYGLKIWRGVANPPPIVPAPARLEVELSDGRPVLSWRQVPSAVRYHVHRASLRRVSVPILQFYPSLHRSQRGVEHGSAALELRVGSEANGAPELSDPIPSFLFKEVWFPQELEPVGVTPDTVFVDQPLALGERRVYIVLAEGGQAGLSEPSNLVYLPILTPATTFGGLMSAVDELERRGRFATPEAVAATRRGIELAVSTAEAGDVAGAFARLESVRRYILTGALVHDPDAADLEIATAKLQRRLGLVKSRLVHLETLF